MARGLNGQNNGYFIDVWAEPEQDGQKDYKGSSDGGRGGVYRMNLPAKYGKNSGTEILRFGKLFYYMFLSGQ